MVGQFGYVNHLASKFYDFRFQRIMLLDRQIAICELGNVVLFKITCAKVILSGCADHNACQSIAFISQHGISSFGLVYLWLLHLWQDKARLPIVVSPP